MGEFDSWGRYPSTSQQVRYFQWPWQRLSPRAGLSMLPRGLGRSYGDSCLNDGGELLSTRYLDRFIAFDTEKGVVRCESGVSFDRLLDVIVPRGWFVPVTPGTRFVTLGGALANDVHGKNHHRAGTFGRHVRSFELLKSSGERMRCSPTEHAPLFAATVGGLGLTGLITWIELQLVPIKSPAISMDSIKFEGLDEFFTISKESDKDSAYTVAWLDCVATGKSFARGIFMKGNTAEADMKNPRRSDASVPLSIPIDFPSFVLNNLSIRAFNWLYFHKQRKKHVSTLVHYRPFFYPLDSIGNWNRIYGKRGFFQFQCVVPVEDGKKRIEALLNTIVQSGRGSFLAVLKEFGDLPSPGMMSFPRRGVTLCLDFPNQGAATLELLRRLDDQTRELGGAIYPAKDATMSPESFKMYYPRWEEFQKYIDPAFSSSFWRRVTE